MKQVLILLVFLIGFQQNTNAQKSAIFIKEGKAIGGYDVVDFHLNQKAQLGDSSYQYRWNAANWYFSSAKNRDLFMATPEKFAPAFGGYCAYGLSQGHKAPTQVETWTVINNTLYFNYNLKVKERWIKQTDSLIAKGQVNWVLIKDKE